MIARAAYVFAAVLVLVAALTSALRFALSQADDYADDVVAALSEAIGAEVRVGAVRAVLRGVEPVVELSQVEVESPGVSGETLRARRLHVEFDLLASLLGERIKISNLHVFDTDFLIVTDAEGRSRISGFLPLDGLLEGASDRTAAPAAGLYLEHANIRWRHEQAGVDYEFTNVNVAFESRGGRLRFGLKTFLPAALGRFLHVAADFDDGAPADEAAQVSAQASARANRFYIRADGVDLARWASLAGRSGDAAGLLNAELWGDWRAGALQRLDGEIACDDCAAEAGAQPQPFSMQTRLSWEARQDGWRLGMLDFGWRSSRLTPGLTIHNTDAAIAHYEDGADLVLKAPVLDAALLDAGARFASARRGAPGRAVEISSGNGSASLSVSLSHPGFTPPELSAGDGGRLSLIEDEVRFVAEYAAGYLDHLLSLSTVGTARGELALEKVSARFPGWSDRGFDFDQVSSSLRYLDDGSTRALHLDGLSVGLDGARLGGRAAWLGGETPSLDLALVLENLPLASVAGLLPREALDPELREWLERAFGGGVLKSARIELAGPPASFPFEGGGGRFHAEGEAAGATLHYRTDRRPLRKLDARVVFDNQRLLVEASNLEHYGLQSRSARVEIKDLTRPVITVAASGAGPLPGVFDYLKDARLVDPGGVVMRSLEPGGGSRLSLSVEAPLSDEIDEPVSVNGVLNFDGASLRVAPLNLEFSGLTGALDFSPDGGSARSLAATLNGVPVRVEAAPARGKTTLRIEGELAAEELMDLSQTPLHGAVRGTAPWKAELLIPGLGAESEYELHLSLSSSLEGVEVALPSPFGKTAARRREFSADVNLGETNRYKLSYGKDLRAAFVEDAGARSPAQGYLHFGPSAPPPIEHGRFKISGVVAQPVELDDWFGSGNAGGGFAPYLKHVALSFAELRKGGNTLGGASVEIEPGGDAHELRIDAPWARGRVLIPDEGAVLAKMERLFLPKSTPTVSSKLDPADLPPLEIEAREFGLGELRVSNLSLITEPSNRGMKIGRLAFEAGETAGVMSGEWSFNEQGHLSRFRFDVNGRDHGKMLRLLGVSSSLKGGDGSLTGRVVWADSPAGFTLEKLEGSIGIQLRDGVVEKADPGVGRLLGLFSVGHVVRRLSLDFRDVIEGGLAFDTLEGKVGFRDSVMRTEDFVIVGPALAMSISGETDVVREQYDQDVTVVPNLSSGLPVAAALLGGPIGAAAVFLADKLTDLGSRMDEIVTLRYHLHGSWDDPQVEFKGAPEVEKGSGKLKELIEKVLP